MQDALWAARVGFANKRKQSAHWATWAAYDAAWSVLDEPTTAAKVPGDLAVMSAIRGKQTQKQCANIVRKFYPAPPRLAKRKRAR